MLVHDHYNSRDSCYLHLVFFVKLRFSLSSATGLSASAESVKRPSLRRTSSREKQRLHRSSSRRNKENGAKSRATESSNKSRSLETMKTKIVRVVTVEQQPVDRKILDNSREIIEDRTAKENARVHATITTVATTATATAATSTATAITSGDGTIRPQDCTEMDVQTFHVTLTYKPRI